MSLNGECENFVMDTAYKMCSRQDSGRQSQTKINAVVLNKILSGRDLCMGLDHW